MAAAEDNRQGAYARAGVDIEAAEDAVCRMRQAIASTRTAGVLTDAVGSFGGMFALHDAQTSSDPVLVSSIDGVGTKLKIAFLTNRHDTVGRDLVFHCVNDILVQGARPLFFLDYFATGRLSPETAAEVVAGIAQACRDVGCALIGGETAEMPGLYAAGEYDLAGCIVGVVDRCRIVNGETVAPGDVLIGLASNGLHTNGYSLARSVLLDRCCMRLDEHVAALGATLGETLLAGHRCYEAAILPILEEQPGAIKAMAHITGGGLVGNIPRSLPAGLGAAIRAGSWPVPPIFRLIEAKGQILEAEMYRVFNMGVGLALVAAIENTEWLVNRLGSAGEAAFRIGEIVGEPGIAIR